MYVFESLTADLAAKVVQLKEKEMKKFQRMVIPGNIIVSIICFIMLCNRGSKYVWISLLAFGLGTGVIGTWSLIHFWRKSVASIKLIEMGKAEYVVIENLSFDTPIEFTTVGGNKVTQTFSKEGYSKYKGKKACVIYVPETDQWYVEMADLVNIRA